MREKEIERERRETGGERKRQRENRVTSRQKVTNRDTHTQCLTYKTKRKDTERERERERDIQKDKYKKVSVMHPPGKNNVGNKFDGRFLTSSPDSGKYSILKNLKSCRNSKNVQLEVVSEEP